MQLCACLHVLQWRKGYTCNAHAAVSVDDVTVSDGVTSSSKRSLSSREVHVSQNWECSNCLGERNCGNLNSLCAYVSDFCALCMLMKLCVLLLIMCDWVCKCTFCM